ncbi:hypothetical protein CABS01_10633, partial [Colletotrichum abscissum]|uniref:uncharacterized protein n=1 Tax=Colletotrichum abscissum TaxID=1671311 RepID=UPI0027D4CDDB
YVSRGPLSRLCLLVAIVLFGYDVVVGTALTGSWTSFRQCGGRRESSRDHEVSEWRQGVTVAGLNDIGMLVKVSYHVGHVPFTKSFLTPLFDAYGCPVIRASPLPYIES